MATDTANVIFDEIEIMRPLKAGVPGWHESEIHKASETSQVQIRQNAQRLDVWFTEGETSVFHFALLHPFLKSFSEVELMFEGFEAIEGKMGAVNPVPVTVYLSHSRLRDANK